MRIRVFLLLFLMTVTIFGCEPKPEADLEVVEVRIHRWTALDGGEIFVLRRIGSKWTARLQGDDDRLSCSYQREVTPKSDWNSFWNSMLSEGLMDLSGKEPSSGITDGDAFVLEVSFKGKFNLYSVDNPANQQSENAKRILRIGNLIANEFETPVFVADYKRGKVGDYLMNACRALRK